MNETNSRRDRSTALGLFLGFLALYLATLCPTVYFGDSGEISTAIFRGGVIHPPGYPLFALLGRAALILIPFGEPAFRIGCVVALAAALVVVALYKIGRELAVPSVPAAASAAIFGGSYLFWNQSVRVEVYSLHLLLLSGAILFVLRWRASQAPPDLYRACLCVSLGLAHHLTIVLALPALLVLAGGALWTLPRLAQRLGACLGCFLVGPALYGFLPLWARPETGRNWSDTTTLPHVWNHVSARLYQGQVKLPDAAQLAKGVRLAFEFSGQGLPLLLWPVAAFGVWALWRRDRGAALGFLTLALTISAYNLCYRIPDISAYYLPVVLAGIPFVAVAAGKLLERGTRPVYALALAVAPLALISINYPKCNLHNATVVREFSRQKLASCDPNGVLIVEGDQDIFPVMYVHDTLGFRQDVVTLARGMVSMSYSYAWDDTHWYLRSLKAQGLDLELPEPRDLSERRKLVNDGMLIQILDGPLSGRPLYITFLKSSAEAADTIVDQKNLLQWIEKKANPAPQGLLIALHPRSTPLTPRMLAERNQKFWDVTPLPDLSLLDTSQEMDPGYLPQHYVTMLSNQGFLWERAGEPQNAAAIYRTLLEWQPELSRATLERLTPLAAEAVKRTQIAASR